MAKRGTLTTRWSGGLEDRDRKALLGDAGADFHLNITVELNLSDNSTGKATVSFNVTQFRKVPKVPVTHGDRAPQETANGVLNSATDTVFAAFFIYCLQQGLILVDASMPNSTVSDDDTRFWAVDKMDMVPAERAHHESMGGE